MRDRVAIVGAGQAGARVAQALRSGGYHGQICLIGEEPYPPYERPPLSKEFLSGRLDPEKARILPDEFYLKNGIELRTGRRAIGLDPAAHWLECDDGARIGYDKLVLATGSSARRLEVPGNHLSGVFYLRSLGDTIALRAALAQSRRVVVIGGGFMGLEVAASARTLGREVCVLEYQNHVLARVVPTQIGELIAALHRSRGVEIRCKARVSGLEGVASITGVRLESGELIAADTVFVAIGALPNSELGLMAGTVALNGIRVNEFGETDVPDLYATGDVANHPSRWAEGRIRLESWQVAQNHSVCVGRSICGTRTAYDEVPWFWSDQFGVNIQIAGLPQDGDAAFLRGTPGPTGATVFYYRERRLIGAVALNGGLNIRITQQFIARGCSPDPAALVDPATSLKSLMAR